MNTDHPTAQADQKARAVPRWLALRCKKAYGCRLRHALHEIRERYPVWTRNAHTDGEEFIVEPTCLMADDLDEILDFTKEVGATVLLGGEARQLGNLRVAFRERPPPPP